MPIAILVADEDDLFRGYVGQVLAGACRVVAEAAEGEDAVRLAHELQPDVVLLGTTMPFADALQPTVRRIKARDPAIKVVVLTMHHEEAYLADTGKTGSDAFVPKELVKTHLVPAIRRLGPSFAHYWDGDERRGSWPPQHRPGWDGNERRRPTPIRPTD